jgi:hypothetical protein
MMAISENALYDKVYNALVSYSQGEYIDEMETPKHMKIMGDEMKDYFEDNTVITYGWSAANPSSGTTDPVQSFTSEAVFPSFDILQPMSLPGLAAKIMAAFQGAKIRHPAMWQIPDGTFLIKPLVLPQSANANTALMDCIIHPVCVWVKTLVNPSPLSGTHGEFTGATAGMVIA